MSGRLRGVELWGGFAVSSFVSGFRSTGRRANSGKRGGFAVSTFGRLRVVGAASRCRALFLVFDRPVGGPSPANGTRNASRAYLQGRVRYEVFQLFVTFVAFCSKWNFKTCLSGSCVRTRRDHQAIISRLGTAAAARSSTTARIKSQLSLRYGSRISNRCPTANRAIASLLPVCLVNLDYLPSSKIR